MEAEQRDQVSTARCDRDDAGRLMGSNGCEGSGIDPGGQQCWQRRRLTAAAAAVPRLIWRRCVGNTARPIREVQRGGLTGSDGGRTNAQGEAVSEQDPPIAFGRRGSWAAAVVWLHCSNASMQRARRANAWDDVRRD
nr:unnamed protein product [Digitaria exilis]